MIFIPLLFCGIFLFGIMLGWMHSSAWHNSDKDWSVLHHFISAEVNYKYREYWFWIDKSKTRFRVTFGMDNAVLSGSIPPSHIGASAQVLIDYIKSTYINLPVGN